MEVWKNVQANNALADAGDVEGFMAYVHDNYLGWNYQSALPNDKAAVRKFVEYEIKTSKTLLSNINR